METKRQSKVARMLQKDLGEIFQRNASELFEGAFITVTSVKVSPDLASCKVYLSFMMSNNKAATLELVREHGKQVRSLLAARIKHQVRIIPELSFHIDDTEEVAAKVEKLFEDLNIPPADAQDEEYFKKHYKL